MKKLFSLGILMSSAFTLAQTPSLPITTVNNLKINSAIEGDTTMDVLVYPKTGDKVVRYISAEDLINSGKDFATPEMYGAVGDSFADDWQSITNAMNSDFKTIVLLKKYIISKPVYVPTGKTVILNGSVTMQDGFQDLLLSDVSIGASTLSVTGADTKYFVGQQIVLTDTNRPVQGGGTGQTRRTGTALTITNVTGNTITFSGTLPFAYTTAASATIGHCQSVFIIDGSDNVSIVGTGVIDQNKANQFDIEPVEIDGTDEDTKLGCAITFNNSNNVTFKGITLRNSILHNLQFKTCTYINATDFTTDSAHDKNVLLWYCDKFLLSNINTLNADYEDGIILHNDNTNGVIENVYANNCSRSGIQLSTSSVDITVNNLYAVDCGRGFIVKDSENIRAYNIRAVGGGKERYLSNPRALHLISNVVNGDFELEAYNSVFTNAGISMLGLCDNIQLKADIKGLKSSASTGIGIDMSIAVAAGPLPKNITIHNSSIIDTKKAIRLNGATENIKIIDSYLYDNTAVVEDLSTDLLRSFNTKGLINNTLDGSVLIQEENAGASAAQITMDAIGGQPALKFGRTPGTKALPTAISSGSGLARIQVRGYNGSALSAYYQPMSFSAIENWTTLNNGYKFKLQTIKAGGTLGGVIYDFLPDGLSIGESEQLTSPATVNLKAFTGQTTPLIQGKNSSSVVVFKVDVDGNTTAAQYNLSALNTAPSSATDTGTTGEIRIDASYIYVCIALNTWVRSALTTW